MGDHAEPERDPHPRTRLDDSFSTPVRFSLMAALGDSIELDFATLAAILQAGDSVLSKAIAHLQDSGYVATRKVHAGSRPRTWVRATTEGADAFAGHLRALREIVELSGGRMP
ncbi:transcriptional regulator [Microbacterium sp. K24]|jgi:DNA-binding MarR family transcriptional regulator|uniref:transcriptional regulator n=1 Tax=Microbacterium sp. K24 TaxID=2305446 RepID=UPI00109D5253|nr:transcriptional regulator [Microbacterium sp. K24]